MYADLNPLFLTKYLSLHIDDNIEEDGTHTKYKYIRIKGIDFVKFQIPWSMTIAVY